MIEIRIVCPECKAEIVVKVQSEEVAAKHSPASKSKTEYGEK